MKLTITTNVSVDGVMQGLGGSDEDRRGDSSAADGPSRFSTPRPGRYLPGRRRADAFLFGRRAYEIFAGSWGVIERSSAPHRRCVEQDAQVRGVTSLTDPQWAGTTV